MDEEKQNKKHIIENWTDGLLLCVSKKLEYVSTMYVWSVHLFHNPCG